MGVAVGVPSCADEAAGHSAMVATATAMAMPAMPAIATPSQRRHQGVCSIPCTTNVISSA